jgi:hypothetical protein
LKRSSILARAALPYDIKLSPKKGIIRLEGDPRETYA